MDKLLHRGSDIASPAKKPDWRDDDAGTAEQPGSAEVQGILVAAADRMMRTGFEVGTFNKRGVTSRAMDEGGIQERDLAGQCRRNATGLAASHPHLAESLERIARGYECDAKRHDDDAALNQERY
jgi:hypothetical protein